MDQYDHNLGYFVSKSELLETISHLFSSLLDIAVELELIRNRIQHLKHMLEKDLIINSKLKKISTEKVQMTVEQWNDYVNRSDSDEEQKEKK